MGIIAKGGTSGGVDLNDQELTYILTLISMSKFDGKDVFVVANIADKLNKKLEFNQNEARNKRG
jgi:flagellar motor switch protein FliG